MNAIEREDLLAFVDRTEKLRRLAIFRGGLAATFEISGPLGGPARASASEPEPEMVEALVAVLRPLILQSGGTSIGRVFNLCWRDLDDSELRRRLEEVRAAWKHAQKAGVLKLVINDEHWRPEIAADRIINAYYAHDDAEKRLRLRELGAVETMLTRTVFIGFLVQSANAAIQVATVVRTGLRDGKFRS
jgi:hypothetical protein